MRRHIVLSVLGATLFVTGAMAEPTAQCTELRDEAFDNMEAGLHTAALALFERALALCRADEHDPGMLLATAVLLEDACRPDEADALLLRASQLATSANARMDIDDARMGLDARWATLELEVTVGGENDEYDSVDPTLVGVGAPLPCAHEVRSRIHGALLSARDAGATGEVLMLRIPARVTHLGDRSITAEAMPWRLKPDVAVWPWLATGGAVAAAAAVGIGLVLAPPGPPAETRAPTPRKWGVN